MGVQNLLKVFKPQLKLPLHVAELGLVVVVMALAAARLLTLDASAPRSRANTIALAMGAKSIIVILYQILSEHVQRFHRFASYKANLILNCLEIVFWAAVAFIAMQANAQYCKGTSCGLAWAVAALAIIITNVSSYLAGISYKVFRDSKKHLRPSPPHDVREHGLATIRHRGN